MTTANTDQGLFGGDTKHLARRGDPSTSKTAAAMSAFSASDDKAAVVVIGIMSDGIARIDEEIHVAQSPFNPLSESRIRHGRKRAVAMGALRLTGEKRNTRLGGPSREWVYVPAHERKGAG